jgi:hypothetical protein
LFGLCYELRGDRTGSGQSVLQPLPLFFPRFIRISTQHSFKFSDFNVLSSDTNPIKLSNNLHSTSTPESFRYNIQSAIYFNTMKCLETDFSCPASINNCAVSCLKVGRADKAMEFLQLGLAILRKQFLSKEAPLRRYTDTSQDTCQDGQPCISTCFLSGARLFLPRDACILELYDRALIIDSTDIRQPEVLSAVILYNMGFMHQTHGLTHGNTELLARAHRFYQISLDVLEKNDIIEVDPLLYLALFNNAAHIGASLCQVETMRQCIEAVRNIMETDGDLIDEEDYEFFYTNTICCAPAATLAPAA